jgi:hypothetical protein
MKKLIPAIILTLCSAQAWAAAYTSCGSGNWSAPATWNDGVLGCGLTLTVPVNGDTVTVNHAVTVDVFTAVGHSPGAADATPAILMNTGAVTVNAGVTFVVRGDIKSANKPLTLNAGSIFEWDASLAASPSTAIYRFYNSADNQPLSGLIVNGTSGNHAVVRSNAGGANGKFVEVNNYGMTMDVTYCDFLRIGDAANEAILFGMNNGTYKMKLNNCTFTSCGRVKSALMSGAYVLDIQNNVFTSGLHATDDVYFIGADATVGGTRLINGNVFNKAYNGTGFKYFTVTNNVFYGGFGANLSTTANRWTAFSNNFFRNTTTTPTCFSGDIAGLYYLMDTVGANPHFMVPNSGIGDLTWDSILFDYIGTDGTGNLINMTSVPPSQTTITVQHSISLPNAGGDNAGAFIGLDNSTLLWKIATNQNTVFIGTQYMYEMGHFSAPAGSYISMKNNLMWDNSLRGYKAVDTDHYGTGIGIITDLIVVGAADYNASWNVKLSPYTTSGNSWFTNQGNGYVGAFSVTPGANDINLGASPSFVDSGRNIAKWGQALHGTDGTVAGALAALKTDTSRIAELISYVQFGFTPTNPALKATGFGGVDIGAVAVVPKVTFSPIWGLSFGL